MLALWQQNKSVKSEGENGRDLLVLIDYDTSLTFTKLACNSPPNRQTSFKRKEFLYTKFFVFT